MAIDFSATENATTYSGRRAHNSWSNAIRSLMNPAGTTVVDVGCGGGIYTRAWLNMGAHSVTGVDSSVPIVAEAQNELDDDRATFVLGDALNTGLATSSADVVFSRAVVHHLEDLQAFAREAVRLTRPGGRIIIQDRTMEDVEQPPSAEHLRGFFFERFPQLLEVERGRRPSRAALVQALESASGQPVQTHQLWEVRTVHETAETVLTDIRSRKGRSILHELDDEQLASLTDHIAAHLPPAGIRESDRWTLWSVRL